MLKLQTLVEPFDQTDTIVAGVFEVQLAQNGTHELDRCHHRVENQRGRVVLSKLFQYLAADGAFAGADVTRYLDEALAFGDAEEDVFEGLPVLAAESD